MASFATAGLCKPSFALKPVAVVNLFFEMGGTCSTTGDTINAYKILIGRLEGKS
jgi:hypothetical protein